MTSPTLNAQVNNPILSNPVHLVEKQNVKFHPEAHEEHEVLFTYLRVLRDLRGEKITL